MSQAPKAVIDVRDLVKVYPGGTRAVDGIDFAVHEGEFFGFLGPNGAGKSTALKILSTLLKKTSGNVTVAGYDVDSEAEKIRRSVGVAMQTAGLDDLAKAHDFLTLQGRLYGLRSSEARARSAELLDFIGLSSVADKKIGTFSGGMRRRLDLVATLVHQPKVLFLDEPTTGLDPQSRMTLWDHLRRLNSEEGVTIILTTQMMDEADRLCERLAIIDRGKIVAEGSPRELKEQIGGDSRDRRSRLGLGGHSARRFDTDRHDGGGADCDYDFVSAGDGLEARRKTLVTGADILRSENSTVY